MKADGDIKLTMHSCITLTVSRGDAPPKADWIFFSSPSGVHLFASHFGLPRNTRIAVLGEGTEQALLSYAIKPDFRPSFSDPQEAIEQFCEALDENDRVLIPRSALSLQRFKDVLPEHQLVDWPFYSNTPNPPPEPFTGDVLIFTSPSNVDAYFSKHQLKTQQSAVAIGAATFDALIGVGIKSAVKSSEPTEPSMWKAAQQAMNGK